MIFSLFFSCLAEMHVKHLLRQVTGKNLLHKDFHVCTPEDAECSNWDFRKQFNKNGDISTSDA